METDQQPKKKNESNLITAKKMDKSAFSFDFFSVVRKFSHLEISLHNW